jgi:hypothetical protein
MSSSSRQRPYPIPPLLPQLAESTLIGSRIHRSETHCSSGQTSPPEFKDALADRAGSQGAPRSPRIRFRQCDPPRSRSRAQPQPPSGVCRRGRPKAHEADPPRSRHRWLSQLRMPVPFQIIWLRWRLKKGAPVRHHRRRSQAPLRSKPTCTISPRSPTWTRDVPVTAARSPSCEPDHYDLDRPMRYDLGNVAFARRILHQQAVASRE